MIEGSTAKGCRLIKTPEFSVEELRALINPSRPPLKLRGGEGGVMSMERIIGKEIIFHESLDSTNTLAMELAEKGLPHGTVVIADRQLKGKGRLGRTWFSPPQGNIYMSVIVRPEIEPKDATLLTIMSAISCARAIRNSTGLEVKIKWPNDLMVSERKLGGILTEMKSGQDRIVFAVIGIGINVTPPLCPPLARGGWGGDAFPPEVRSVAASVMEELRRKETTPLCPPLARGGWVGKEISRTLIIAAILSELEKWFKVLIKGGRIQLINEWKKLSSTLGKKVKVVSGKDTSSGIAEDIDDEGMLILRLPSGGLKKISAGDVIMLR
ncbi:MAG: biotin--[acetyl-CoA-carboxylase] ligase [Nitrospirae bacterium CG22_combo_CG10-13_8_21_14_all_44_11]|nr:biotin--[acetyl-CoA-carboxylase] ligase [Nitrospirota bacterium]OIO32302.1 MAG: biotin--[acetyl-CoA-carboxylase] ligase [Nitrospirae bacterium CG1_02_44_142]PIP70433.1 MAG: biotin--[acetyl-CoA-carboxylase] ligase [Nitrospirae bacterium CG22_combo_CG10-13_8_21_14_all_44_11]PIV43827.1 MAG: biotin--[acetyl-CoA-carboxylase] ligase [Nitrospirae bacterium CG02_land_8_20_14_3_00_44_33]